VALLDSFRDSIGLMPIVRHPKCNIDYSCNFNTSRFCILDHFLLSGSLFNHFVVEAFVLHSVDNMSLTMILLLLALISTLTLLDCRSEISCLGCLGLRRLAVI